MAPATESGPAGPTGGRGQPRGLAATTIILVAAAAMVGTLPGRTQGLGLVTEQLMADLGIDRVAFAGINFWATLIGTIGAVAVGRSLDRRGVRLVLIVVAIALGLVVLGMSRIEGLVLLAIAITLTRALGQSALSVVSLTLMGRTFTERPTAPMAAYSIILSVGFMLAFPLVGAIVQSLGWRVAWASIGLVLVGGLAPLGAIALRGGEGAAAADAAGHTPAAGHTLREALASGAFWVFALGAAMYGLVASGIGLFNESILRERGFPPEVFHQTLAVTAITALAGNFAAGAAVARVADSAVLAMAMGVLAAGLVALPFVTTLGQVYAWAAAMGIGGGCVMVLFFSAWPRLFGRRALGRIQGVAQALTVLASAVGPLVLASTVEIAGSYAPAFFTLAILVALLGVAALLVPPPRPAVE